MEIEKITIVNYEAGDYLQRRADALTKEEGIVYKTKGVLHGKAGIGGLAMEILLDDPDEARELQAMLREQNFSKKMIVEQEGRAVVICVSRDKEVRVKESSVNKRLGKILKYLKEEGLIGPEEIGRLVMHIYDEKVAYGWQVFGTGEHQEAQPEQPRKSR